MNTETDLALWERFFGLNTVGELRQFYATLDQSVPEQASLAYYIASWLIFSDASDGHVIDPLSYLSEDRSAVMYGAMPVIFEGTNKWSSKAHSSTEQLVQKFKNIETMATKIRDANCQARMVIYLIPEKDYVISRFFIKDDRFVRFDAAIDALKRRMAELGIPLIYDQPFHNIQSYQKLSEYEFRDSHLAGRNYITLFGFGLEQLGVSWASVKSSVTLTPVDVVGDLVTKFDNALPIASSALEPNVPKAEVTLTAGTPSFESPLGDTWQDLSNNTPKVDQSVCLLGDSHCSIFEKRKLTYLYASTFRETHFEWNPFGIRKKPNVSSYDNIVVEISSRFIM